MLPGGQVEDGEGLLDALHREVTEETGLTIVAEPFVAFDVEVDDRARSPEGPHRAVTYRCEATGELQPDDPDGLVRRAAWVETPEAVRRLSEVDWYESEPLRRYLSGEAGAGEAYRYPIAPNAPAIPSRSPGALQGS